MSPLESSEAADASTVPGARPTGEETLRPGQPLGRGRQPTGRPGPEAGWRRLCLSGTLHPSSPATRSFSIFPVLRLK